MKKMIAILLSLIVILSLIPVSAMATPALSPVPPALVPIPPEAKPVLPEDSQIIPGNPQPAGPTQAEQDALEQQISKMPKKKKDPVYYHEPGQHEYAYASNPTYHWLQCPCGCKINMEPHVDPLEAENDYCFCGYHFSDNADLVTLWLKDCKELKNFRKNVYEYETDAYTYKEVNELTRIATRTFDSEATVELPEDLTLKEGENKIEIKVTSENKKVTKIYTVIVNKEAKK